jgi:hypothetical protein
MSVAEREGCHGLEYQKEANSVGRDTALSVNNFSND